MTSQILVHKKLSNKNLESNRALKTITNSSLTSGNIKSVHKQSGSAIDLQNLYKTHDKQHEPSRISSKILQIEQSLGIRKDDEFKKLIGLLFGRRIIKKQMKKKNEVKSKNQQKKKETQSQKRWYQIQTCNYDEIQKKKIAEHIFIFRPYKDNRGFNPESSSFKHSYPRTLKYIEARDTLKLINNLYYQHSNDVFESSQVMKTQKLIKTLSGIVYIVIFILFFVYFSNISSIITYIAISIFTFYGVFLVIQSIKSRYSNHDNLSQMQRLISKIKRIFCENQIKVRKDQYKPIKYFWTCPDHFLWVQVRLMGNFIENREGQSKRILI